MPLALGPVHWDSVRTGACLWTCGEDAGLGGVAYRRLAKGGRRRGSAVEASGQVGAGMHKGDPQR